MNSTWLSVLKISSLGAITTLFLAVGSEAQSSRLSDPERQFIGALDGGELDKANFYVSEGIVDPYNLSTGRSLESYLYGGWGCRDWTSGNCTPALEGAEYLIGMGVDLNKSIRAGQRPLTYVCWGKYFAVNNSKLLIEQGVEVDFFDADGFTPLHYCVSRQARRADRDDLKAVMDTLINAGADVNTRSTTLISSRHTSYGEQYGAGYTPLMMAVEFMGLIDNRDWETIEYLIEKGADATAVDGNGFAVANYIAYPDRARKYEPTLDLLKILHAAGADIMHETPQGQNLFSLAVDRGELDFAMSIRKVSESPR